MLISKSSRPTLWVVALQDAGAGNAAHMSPGDAGEAGEPWTALPFKTGDAGKLHVQAQRLSTGGHHKAAARVRRHRLSLDFVSPCWCAS